MKRRWTLSLARKRALTRLLRGEPRKQGGRLPTLRERIAACAQLEAMAALEMPVEVGQSAPAPRDRS